ncbi:MAG TPA: DUF1569 domain-containing protein [Acidobacteriota bacterium]|nr:DUF1569 domain-containing protein [Acidobacteriota bacterium]
MRKTFFDPTHRVEIVSRLGRLTPETPRRWGTMNAPRMVAHLRDQMAHCLGDQTPTPVPGILRWSLLRHASIYWIPWPKGRLKGPPDAFVTPPGDWSADIEDLIASVNRFACRDIDGSWPDHALFGPMTGRDWGYFCFKHFDHHLRQFGQ